MYLTFLSFPRFGQSVRRHPLLAVAFTGLILTLAVGGGLQLVAWNHYRAARAALEDGRLEDARADLQLCLWAWPYSADTLLLAARIERIDSQFLPAENYLNQCKHLQNGVTDKTQLEWTLLRAVAGGFDEAETGLWSAVKKKDPEAPYILEALTACYIHRAFFNRALTALNEWIKLEPNNPRALDSRAFVLGQLQSYDDARADFKKLVRVAPSNWKSRLHFATFLLDENNPDEALKHLKILEKDHADNGEVQLGMARYYFLKNRFDESRKICDQLLAREPDFWVVMYHRARLEKQAENFPEAEKWARRALALEPSRHDLHLLLYQILTNLPGHEKEAEEQYKRQDQVQKDATLIRTLITNDLEKQINNPDIYSQIGAAYIRLGLGKAGVTWLERALRKDAHHKATHAILAHYYEENHQPELAARHRQQAQ